MHVLTRALLRFELALIVPFLVVVGALFGTGLNWWTGFLGFTLVAWTWWCIVRFNRASNAIVRRARAADARVCPHCAYDLSHHDHSGACPECGRPYTREQLRRAWARYLSPH